MVEPKVSEISPESQSLGSASMTPVFTGVIKGMTLRANPCVHNYREIGGAYSIYVGLHDVFV